jgi:hypothetical protein
MMDKVGKVFIVQPPLRKCVICDVLMSRAECRVHSVEICFPAPSACPPIPYGVVEGEA